MAEVEYILLVDDDPGVLRSMSIWLKGEGFAVLTAVNREQALRQQRQRNVVLALLDLRLKDDDGLQIGAELCAHDEMLRVIIITGYPTVEGAVDAMRAGVFDYISKDADNDQILETVRRALSERSKKVMASRVPAEKRTGVVLVGHHVLIREGLESMFRETPDFVLQRTFHAFDYIRPADFSLDTELLLLCEHCNEVHFVTAAKMFRELKLVFPKARLLLINCTFDEERKLELVRLGARGFLPPHAGRDTIKRAFQALLHGEMWISRSLSDRLLSDLLADTAERVYVKPASAFSLSKREIEILQAMASGLSNAQIGDKLFLSEKTVKTHVHHIFCKLEVSSRTQAVLKAMKAHLL